jgi:hypothetical protein
MISFEMFPRYELQMPLYSRNLKAYIETWKKRFVIVSTFKSPIYHDFHGFQCQQLQREAPKFLIRRLTPLGFDRDFNSYWFFDGSGGIEKDASGRIFICTPEDRWKSLSQPEDVGPSYYPFSWTPPFSSIHYALPSVS